MLNKKANDEDISVIGSCLSVNLYVRRAVLTVACYPKVLQR